MARSEWLKGSIADVAGISIQPAIDAVQVFISLPDAATEGFARDRFDPKRKWPHVAGHFGRNEEFTSFAASFSAAMEPAAPVLSASRNLGPDLLGLVLLARGSIEVGQSQLRSERWNGYGGLGCEGVVEVDSLCVTPAVSGGG